MDIWSIIITATVIIISIACLYYMYAFKRRANTDAIIDEAVLRAEYTPTIFKIYDKSTDEICNRFIVVSPFDWYIWACRGELYILNPESGIKCAPNTTPAVQVLKDQFLETCLKLNLNSILDMYVNGKTPYIVPYEIESTTFTILSALNILMKEYITFHVDDTPTLVNNNNLPKLAKMRHLTGDDLMNDFLVTNIFDEHAKKRAYRVLSGEDVIKITTPRIPSSQNLSELQKYYSKHTAKMKSTLALQQPHPNDIH
nr:TPA: 19kDa protein [Oryctes rhinoceros nudivirus]